MRLVTNLQGIHLLDSDGRSKMHIDAHALVLETVPSGGWSPFGEPSREIRGYATSGSTPVFTIKLDCDALDYEIKKQEPVIDGAIPLSESWLWADGTHISFMYGLRALHEEEHRELDVVDLADLVKREDGTYNSDEVYNGSEGVYTVLAKKVALHWGAPYMPVTTYHSAAKVRDALDRGARA